MSLKLESKFPGGNARRLSLVTRDDMPVVSFAADPCQGARVSLVLFSSGRDGAGNRQGGESSAGSGVFRQSFRQRRSHSGAAGLQAPEQGLDANETGKINVSKDGRHSVSWVIDYPNPSVEVAVSFPYGALEIKQMVGKTKGYWNSDTIGLTQSGRPIQRLSNHYGTPGGKMPGIYLVARQNPGEVPGSWVLDGLLRELARTRNQRCLVWVIPLADIDGIARGEYGKKNYPFNLNRSWGDSFYRHETLVMQNDLKRWQGRCQPALGINFNPPASATPRASTAICPMRSVLPTCTNSPPPGPTPGQPVTAQIRRPRRRFQETGPHGRGPEATKTTSSSIAAKPWALAP